MYHRGKGMVAGSLRDNGAVWLLLAHIPVEQEAEGMRTLALRSHSPFLLFVQARIPVHGMVPPTFGIHPFPSVDILWKYLAGTPKGVYH